MKHDYSSSESEYHNEGIVESTKRNTFEFTEVAKILQRYTNTQIESNLYRSALYALGKKIGTGGFGRKYDKEAVAGFESWLLRNAGIVLDVASGNVDVRYEVVETEDVFHEILSLRQEYGKCGKLFFEDFKQLTDSLTKGLLENIRSSNAQKQDGGSAEVSDE